MAALAALAAAVADFGMVERSFSDEMKAGGLVLLTIDHHGTVSRT